MVLEENGDLARDGVTKQRQAGGLMRFLRLAVLLCGWAGLAYLLWVSVSPIGSRPHFFDAIPDISRFLGWFVIAFAFAVVYPRRPGWVLFFMSVAIVAFEAAQLLEATRHGRPHDAVVKIAGAAAAVMLLQAWLVVSKRLSRSVVFDAAANRPQ